MQIKPSVFILSILSICLAGCQAAPTVYIPMSPAVSAVLVKAETDAGKKMLGQEKILISDQRKMETFLHHLEKHKDSAETPTFDYARKYDFSVFWQLKETGKADHSRLYLQINQPQLLIYSMERVDKTNSVHVAKISTEEARELWDSLGIKNFRTESSQTVAADGPMFPL